MYRSLLTTVLVSSSNGSCSSENCRQFCSLVDGLKSLLNALLNSIRFRYVYVKASRLPLLGRPT